jgi:hypothetical protein
MPGVARSSARFATKVMQRARSLGVGIGCPPLE